MRTKINFSTALMRAVLALALILTFASLLAAQTIVGQVSIGNQPISQIAVNPTTKRVYIGGGYAQNPVMVIDASDPTNPTIVTTVSGGGVTVNQLTNRFYTSNGFGGQILVYDGATNTQIAASPSTGFCGGQFDLNPTRNLIYMMSQCGGGNDPLHVLDGATNNFVAGPLGSGGVARNPRVNWLTGRAYASQGGATRVFGPPPSFSFLADLPGIFIVGVNPITNRLYFSAGADLQVRDGNDHSLIATIPGAAAVTAINVARNLIYAVDAANKAANVIDGVTNQVASSFQLITLDTLEVATPIATNGLDSVDPTQDLIFLAGRLADGTQTLFVVQHSPGP